MFNLALMTSKCNLCYGVTKTNSLCEKKIKDKNSFFCKEHISQQHNPLYFVKSMTSWILKYKLNINKINNIDDSFCKFLLYNKKIINEYPDISNLVNIIINLLGKYFTFEDMESDNQNNVEKNIEPLTILNTDIVEI
jgi:hypothetical protein